MESFKLIFPWIIYLGAIVCGEKNSDYSTYANGKCETLTVELCVGAVPYNQTVLPNMLGHETQKDAEITIETFYPLLQYGCSTYLKQFLCIVLVPPCTILETVIPPCKSLCMMVAKDCVPVLITFGFPAGLLDCSGYPEEGVCIGTNVTVSNVTSDVTTARMNTFDWYTGMGSMETATDEPLDYDTSTLVNLFLLVTSGHKIQIVDVISASRIDTITLYSGVDAKLGAALDFYMPGQFIYWASKLEGKIFRGRLVMDNLREVRPIIDTASANVESLAVDWLLGVLFWTETFPASLKTSSLSGRRVTTLLSRGMDHPISLTLDPMEGKVFWIDRRGDVFNHKATIECYSMVTEKRDVLFNISANSMRGGGRPKALVTDVNEKRLFWVDARSESLHSMRYDGTDQRILLRSNQYLQEPDSIAIFGDHVIWTDKTTGSLVSAKKHDGSDLRVIKKFESHPPLNLRVFQQDSQPSVTAKYDKSSLTQQWQELSSRENMELEDYDEYDGEYEVYDTSKSSGRRKNEQNNTGSGCVRNTSTFTYLVFCVLVSLTHSSRDTPIGV